MSMRINKKYLKGSIDTGMFPLYIIEAPKNVRQLEGYVMKIRQDNVEISDNNIILLRGNEWNQKQYKKLYMFEKEFKVEGSRSKRYRYTEEEAIRLYGSADSSTFTERLEKRERIYRSGTGRLIRAEYTEYSKSDGMISRKGWFIASDENAKWCYDFDYDPLRDTGKHNMDAKGFKLLEEYSVSDVAIIHENKEHLEFYLHELNHLRNLKPNTYGIRDQKIPDRDGHLIAASSMAENIAFCAYNQIPKEITEYGTKIVKGTQKGEEIRAELIKLSTEIENKCNEFIKQYQSEQINYVSSIIKKMTGIEIKCS